MMQSYEKKIRFIHNIYSQVTKILQDSQKNFKVIPQIVDNVLKILFSIKNFEKLSCLTDVLSICQNFYKDFNRLITAWIIENKEFTILNYQAIIILIKKNLIHYQLLDQSFGKIISQTRDTKIILSGI